jgi:type I restriction enzyme S subunit
MGSEWPPDWTRARLGDVADVNWGDTSTTKASYVAQGFPAYSASGRDGFLDHADVHRTGVVVSAIGADCGKTWLAKGDWSCIKNTIRYWSTDPRVDTEFLYWLTREPSVWPRRGSAQPFISQGDARALPIAYPPLPLQRQIARTLGALDDKIELNRRMSQTLESMARALFKSWFVDFDPVRAKAEGRAHGLPQEIAQLFPSSFCDSGSGEIPCGWTVESVYRIANVIYGAPFRSALFNDQHEGAPLIRIRDLETHDPQIHTPENHPRGYLVSPGDLVVGMDGEFRAHRWRGPKAWLNQRLCCFKPVGNTPRAFVHYSIEDLLRFFEGSKTGTTVIHLGKGDIDTFRILVPPRPVLGAFAAIVDPIDGRLLVAAQEARSLHSSREHILPSLLTGRMLASASGLFAEAAN